MRFGPQATKSDNFVFFVAWMGASLALLPFLNALSFFLSTGGWAFLAEGAGRELLGYLYYFGLVSVLRVDNFLLLAGPLLFSWPYFTRRFPFPERSLAALSLSLAGVAIPGTFLGIFDPIPVGLLLKEIRREGGLSQFAWVMAAQALCLWLMLLGPRLMLSQPTRDRRFPSRAE